MSTTTETISLVDLFEAISDGPNREALFDSLRLQESNATVTFGFELKRVRSSRNRPTYVGGRILAIEAEDGSGHSWIITFAPQWLERGPAVHSGSKISESSIKLYYRDHSTDAGRSRTGSILPS